MAVIHAAQALTPEGWRSDVRLTIHGARFDAIEIGVAARPGDERHAIALPGMPNLHSHAFQRAVAGLAEVRGTIADSFWTWRELMYRFALLLTPDHVEAVAAEVYVEMLEAGFTRVGEFHYLHHDRDGRHYGSIAEMAQRIAAAAGRTGIALTLLPVFYARGSFGGEPPTEGQRRFICDLDAFARVLEDSRKALTELDGAVLGVAPHSLRAVVPEELAAVTAMAENGPIHIHVAEQLKEVADCLAWSGSRPVEWLMDHVDVDGRWCLIHATHMSEAETARLAGSGAVVGLCPMTEANLGDGTFNGPEFLARGGRFGVGSDSNVLIGLADELRQLEYAQRLKHRARNVMAVGPGSTGRALFERALQGGARALGVDGRGLAVGAPADIVTLDRSHPALAARDGDELIDAWIFAGGNAVVDCVWVGGRKLVEGGRHHLRDEARASFRKAMEDLRCL